MNAETLERLLMDRALGALAPDVDALVAAYLEHDATAAARAAEFAQAASAARDVLRQDMAAALPPFPGARIQSLERSQRQLRLVRNVAGLAAAVLIGIGLGFSLFSRSAPRMPVPAAAPALLVAAAPPAPTSVAPGAFWSSSRLYAQARSVRPTETRLIWDSAVSAPRVGGDL